MTERIAARNSCLRSSHKLFHLQPPSKDQVPKGDCLLHLVQQMPTVFHRVEESATQDEDGKTKNREHRPPSFRLVVSSDVDPVSVALLKPSWFFNVIVTITDRNGCVIYHESHSSNDPYLRNHSPNFVDVRWGDFIHPPDADIWSQHLLEAFAEADRWRAIKLMASRSQPPPPLPLPPTIANSGGIRASGNGSQHRRRRASLDCGGGSASQLQQQVVSTTSRLSPDSATEEAPKRRFVLSPLYRARCGGLGEVFYFRTVSLPVLRNQTSITDETTNVFSPTSSFDNLLLLNYHCILGQVPKDALSEAVRMDEAFVLDAMDLHRMQKSIASPPLMSPIASAAAAAAITTTASSIDRLSRLFSFENLDHGDEADGDVKVGSLNHQPAELYHTIHGHGGRRVSAYKFADSPKVEQNPLSVDPHPASYSNAHLAPVDIDWIDQSQSAEQKQQQHYSGMTEVKSTTARAQTMQNQMQRAITMERLQSRHQQRVSISELNKTASQHDRISIFLSLLLPEAIKEIKEAVTGEPDMVAQRVRAIVTRHLGQEFLSKFFAYPPHASATITTSLNPNVPHPPSFPASLASSTAAPSSSVTTYHGTTTTSTEADCCGNATTRDALTVKRSTPFLMQSSKRPSLVQELSVASDNDSQPPPIFYNSNSVRNHFSSICSVSHGLKPHGHATPLIPSAQNSGTATPASFDSMTGSSPCKTTVRVSQQAAPSLSQPLQSSSASSSQPQQSDFQKQTTTSPPTSTQEVHSTAGVLESLLMGGYVPPDSRLRHVSGSSTATVTTAIATARRHRNASTGGWVSECHQTLPNGGPSPACSSGLGFDMEKWSTFTSTAGASGCDNSLTSARTGTMHSAPQMLASPNTSSPCSSLAHLLRHGCPPASASTVASTTTALATTESLPSSSTLSTACVRISRLSAFVDARITAPPRPVDCPLSVIVDSQPFTGRRSPTHQLSNFVDAEEHYPLALSPKTQDPSSSKVPLLAPQTMSQDLAHNANGNIELQVGSGKVYKLNIRDTSEDEDAALANSSLCRLLQGPDPLWETVTAEVDAAQQEDTPMAPPPPPPSFFELPSDVLVVNGGEGGRARFDSCSVTLRPPLSVSSPPQIDVSSVSTAIPSVAVKESVGGITHGVSDGNCCGSTSPSAIDGTDGGISSPLTAERNRRAAAAAAAQIAMEAEQQRRQRPSSRHLLERRRLLFQQNVGQITSYGAGNHSPLESTSSHRYQYHQEQQQSQSNCDCRSCGNFSSTSSATTFDSCNQMKPTGAVDFCQLDSTGPLAVSAVAISNSQVLVNQRAPLEYFSRQMKEIAPNVRVSPSGYTHHPSFYPTESQHQPQHQAPHMFSTYSGGHLTPLNFERQDYQATALSEGLFTMTPSQYENSTLDSLPPCPSQLPPIQPKLPNYHKYYPNSHFLHPFNHQQQQQQTYYQPQPYHQYTSHPCQGSSLPQPPPSSLVGVPEACANSPGMAYFDQNIMHQEPPPQPSSHVPSLPQGLILPQSQVKASLREKVTNRCQAANLDAMAIGPAPTSLLPSTVPSHSVGLVSTTVMGQKRPHPPDSLNDDVGGCNTYFYGSSPLHYNNGFDPVATEIGLPFFDNSTYECYHLEAPLSPQIPRFAECQSLMPFEPQQYAPISDESNVDHASAITAIYNDGTTSSNISEDVQLTADIVNDVLELEALL